MADRQPILTFDPFAAWREWIVKCEQQWSEGLAQSMKDDRVADAMGKQLQQARFLQKSFGEMVQPYLAGMNLPSRSDIESFDERLGRVEDGLAAVEAAIVQLRSAVVEAGAASPARAGGIAKLPRTRKAPTNKR